jgi:REP element-mobilizing transposase RayT
MLSVAAYHLIWTVYGYWLPNDPRGSMSKTIRNDVIAELGEIHYGRKRHQPTGRVVGQFQHAASDLLKHELLTFTDDEIVLIGEAFAQVVRRQCYTCYACAIMPDHVHLVVRKHRDKAEEMIDHFQEASALAMRRRPRHGENHPVWGGPEWKVFLFTQGDITRTNRYVEWNPEKARRPAQEWEFVVEYDGWLPPKVSFRKPQTNPGGKGIANPQARDPRLSGEVDYNGD